MVGKEAPSHSPESDQGSLVDANVMSKKKAAGYVRVSTKQQKEDDSHKRQEEMLRNWADQNDYEIDIYRDIAVSGQSQGREAYEELLSSVEQYDIVVVRELSRFGRSLKKILNDIEDLEDKGVDFKTISGTPIDTSSAQGKLLFQIIGAINEFWANLAREHSERMIERRREEGKNIGRKKKLDPSELEEVYEWRKMGHSYGVIATLVQEVHGKSVDPSTIYRYCQEADIEKEQ